MSTNCSFEYLFMIKASKTEWILFDTKQQNDLINTNRSTLSVGFV